LTIPIRELRPLERPALLAHFLALGGDDRRLRFGSPIADPAIHAYVERMDFDRDALLGVCDDELHLFGVAHLARSNEHAELGVSVLEGHRGRGIGGGLFDRALKLARNWGLRTLFMHCLAENGAIRHLADKHGARTLAEAGEAEAWLALPPADAASHFGAVFEQRLALFDYALKSQLSATRRFTRALKAGKA
jgi:GNAT superfamily N-acetyltransferase